LFAHDLFGKPVSTFPDHALLFVRHKLGAAPSQRHMWTAPIGKPFFDVTNDLVCCGHMSGLFGADLWPLALMISDGRGPYHSGELEGS
jgi:hypothetical protein